MTFILVCLTALLAGLQSTQALPRDRAAAAPLTGTASVSGVVVSDTEKPLPLRRARVTLVNPDIKYSKTIVTDDTGRFAFRGLPAGRFTMNVTKEAFVDVAYGARRPGLPGTSLLLEAGKQVEGITIRLPKGAVITGVIFDGTGQPLSDVQVNTFQYGYANGERRLISRGRGRSDDRGVYRIFGLRAGSHLVMASQRFTASRDGADLLAVSEADIDAALAAPAKGNGIGVGRPASIAPTYFPNATSPSQATAIDLAAGEERTGIDIHLRMAPMGRIEGGVSFAGGQLPPGIVVALIAADAAASATETFRSTRTDESGRFQFATVVPGDYVISARMTQPGAPNALWASMPVLVDGEAESHVSLELRRGFVVTGRVDLDRTTEPPVDFRGWRIGLTPLVAAGEVSISFSPADVQPDGTFTIGGLSPGRYRVQPVIPPDLASRWMARSVTASGRDAVDESLDVNSDMAGVTVTFTDRIPQISGSVDAPAGTASDDYHVIVFPAAPALRTARTSRIQAVRAGANGRYQLTKLPPGSYLIAVTNDVEPGEWMDPAFLQRLAPSALAISIADGERKVQDLQPEKR